MTMLDSFTAAKIAVGGAALVLGSFAFPGAVAADDTYVVRPGDTVSHVAIRSGVSMSDLRLWNGLEDIDRIYAGQVLRLEPETRTHEVVAGDTLSEIAERYGSTSTELAALNGLGNRHIIRVGWELEVPIDYENAAARSVGVTTSDADIDLVYPELPARIADSSDRRALVPVFEHWADANGISVDLLMAIAWQESGWNQEAVSSVGAVGVGQLMPVTSAWIASDLIGQPDLDRANVVDNIRMSARYLDYLLERYDTEKEAIGAYFQGPTSVSEGEWLDVTEDYVAAVQAQRKLFGGS